MSGLCQQSKLMDYTYYTQELREFYLPDSAEVTSRLLLHGFPDELMQYMNAAREYELMTPRRGPIPPAVKMAGLVGQRAWRFEAKLSPFKIHIALWNQAPSTLATSYEATLDLLDELKEVLGCDAVMRSAVMRDLLTDILPSLSAKQRQELEEYARAAGM